MQDDERAGRAGQNEQDQQPNWHHGPGRLPDAFQLHFWRLRARFADFAGGKDEFRVIRRWSLRHNDLAVARRAGNLSACILRISSDVLTADGTRKFELAHGSEFISRVGVTSEKV